LFRLKLLPICWLPRCVRHSSRGPKSRQVDGWWWSAIRTIVVQLLAPVERASAGGAESETEAVVAAFGRSPSAIILIMQWKRRCEKGCSSGFHARFRQFMASFVARRICPRNRSLRRGECKTRRGPPVPSILPPILRPRTRESFANFITGAIGFAPSGNSLKIRWNKGKVMAGQPCGNVAT